MKKQTLSVVLATYNEEKNLPDCLKSVKDLADEIVIVDGTSQDRTVEIAKSHGAKVIIMENNPMFHINKQKAIDEATKDWILQLDADERVTPALQREIERMIHDAEAKDGYWIPRKNWFLGRFLMKGGVYPDYTLRLYKRGKGHLPQKDVHEQAVVEGEVGYLQEPLIHIADPELGRYLMRFNRYTNLIAKEFKGKKIEKNPLSMLKYMIILPLWWFGKIYVRHKGFMDGWQGFVWAFFSSMRFAVAYWKYLGL
ncbi:MAG TPA: glycosyltransferase family 2 protein [Candidatus Saccharimonadales bacterium]|nr:glycosyltransferase family 2 protein [Candidatus Saccharimonadales bacterium]